MKWLNNQFLYCLGFVTGFICVLGKADTNPCSENYFQCVHSSGREELFNFNVITWNVNLMTDAYIEQLYLKYIAGQDMNNPTARARLIADKLSSKNVDLMVLEEFMDQDLRDIVIGELKKAGYYHSDILGGGYLDNWEYLYNGGVMVFSRHPVEVEDELVLPAVGTQRAGAIGIKYVKLRPVFGRVVHVFAVHLQTIQHNSENEHKNLRWQIDELKRYKSEKKISKNDIVLFIGDFNANSGNKSDYSLELLAESKPYDDFKYLCDQLNAREVAPFQNSLPFSFNNVNNSMAVGKNPLGTLDNILCAKDYICPVGGFMKISRFDVDQEQEGLKFDELSDHYPIEGMLFFHKGVAE